MRNDMEKDRLDQLNYQRKELLEAIAKTEFQHLNNKKVIIIDDSKDALTLMSTYLGQISNIEIRTYSDEFDALRKISSDKPDLLVLDIMLTYSDGMKIGSLLKELEIYKGKILFISSNKNFEHELKTFFEKEVIHFLTKPIDKNHFVETVINLLKKDG